MNETLEIVLELDRDTGALKLEQLAQGVRQLLGRTSIDDSTETIIITVLRALATYDLTFKRKVQVLQAPWLKEGALNV